MMRGSKLFVLVFGAILTLGLALASSPLREVRTHSSALTSSSDPQILQGADLFYENCAVCHGDLAKGFAEARAIFPEEEQRCERCHKPSNPAQMDLAASTWRNAFSVGNAPALQGEGALLKFPNALALNAYIEATMPRPYPGKLETSEYKAITAFLQDINSR